MESNDHFSLLKTKVTIAPTPFGVTFHFQGMLNFVHGAFLPY